MFLAGRERVHWERMCQGYEGRKRGITEGWFVKGNDKMKQRRLRTFVKIVLYPFILKKKNYRCLSSMPYLIEMVNMKFFSFSFLLTTNGYRL